MAIFCFVIRDVFQKILKKFDEPPVPYYLLIQIPFYFHKRYLSEVFIHTLSFLFKYWLAHHSFTLGAIIAQFFKKKFPKKLIIIFFAEFDLIAPPWPMCLYRPTGTTVRQL